MTVREDLLQRLQQVAAVQHTTPDLLLEKLLDSLPTYQFAAYTPDTLFILTLPEFVVEYMNRPDFLGYSVADLRENGGYMSKIHAEDQGVVAEYSAMLNQALTNGPFELTWRMYHAKGDCRYIRGRSQISLRDDVTGAPQQLVLSAEDVTEQVALETALAESEMRYRILLENLPASVVTLYDRDLRCLLVAGPEAVNLAVKDTIGRYASDFMPPQLAEFAFPRLQAALAGHTTTVEEEGMFTDKIFWKTYVPIRNAAQVVTHVMVLMQDITERRQTEEQALTLRVEREKAHVLSAFLKTASHEFRTPLANINAKAYLASFEKTDEGRQAHLDVIREQVARIVRLVDAMATMTRLQLRSDEPPAVWKNLQINEMLRSLCMGYQPVFESRMIALHLELAPEEQPIYGDPDDLRLVFSELIDNAVRFTPPEGTFNIRAWQDETYAHIVFKDSGRGIRAEHLTRIFERFYKTDDQGETAGFGLGLAIASRILEIYGGTIHAESTEGEGSSFYIKLPVNS